MVLPDEPRLPQTRRAISVGGGAAYIDIVIDGGTGLILSVETVLNKPGHVKVANGSVPIIDEDRGTGSWVVVIPLQDRWVPDETGMAVELTVRWP